MQDQPIENLSNNTNVSADSMLLVLKNGVLTKATINDVLANSELNNNLTSLRPTRYIIAGGVAVSKTLLPNSTYMYSHIANNDDTNSAYLYTAILNTNNVGTVNITVLKDVKGTSPIYNITTDVNKLTVTADTWYPLSAKLIKLA